MPLYSEDELLPISALQHLAYCPRQYTLIHLEQIWADNRYTTEGNLLHAKADTETREVRGERITARGLRLHSFSLGLSGIADVVEFLQCGAGGCQLPGRPGCWQPLPVEYKRGRPKKSDCDRVQLCAQALCLEEMLDVTIEKGALFYGKTRHRKEVHFDGKLRERVQSLADELHRLWKAGYTPPPEYGEKCRHCSLQSHCLPQLSDHAKVEKYLHLAFNSDEVDLL